MNYFFPVLLGKAVRVLTKLRGGGSAFPGFLTLKVAPNFLRDVAASFEHGIVFVLGSNGKSTTTHMLAEVLTAHGLRVFTNPSGANLPQGIASSIIAEGDALGRINADIGVLEVDEAFAQALAATLRPSTVLMLNTQVDQLYRFYETERVADMMLNTAATATRHIISNRDDPYLSKVTSPKAVAVPVAGGSELAADPVGGPEVVFFGASEAVIAASPHGLINATDYRGGDTSLLPAALAELIALEGAAASVAVGGTAIDVALPARGLHYAVDAAAALATAATILGERFDPHAATKAFSAMKPAYGRGELLDLGDEQVEFVMFKNAASLQLNLDAMPEPPEQVLLAIDEGTPDISWIYDVSFTALDHIDVITGAKAWQIALRLEHEGMRIGTVEPDLDRAIDLMRAMPCPSRGMKTWIVNYEIMMLARRHIGFADLEHQS